MKLRPDQLASALKKGLSPIYLIHGDEPLQQGEAAQAVRDAARAAGHSDRETLVVDGQFDWSSLEASASAMSLFGDRRVIELRMPGGKPGTEGGKVLAAYAERPADDAILLIVSGKIDARSQKTKWFQALDNAGVNIPVWPIEAQALPRWIEDRLRAAGLTTDPGVARLLAERVEGNMLAARQEIDKLALLCDDGRVDEAAVLGGVGDSARYSAFGLADAALNGEAARALRMADGLRAEGEPLPVILGSLAYRLNQLVDVLDRVDAGQPLDPALKQARLFGAQAGPIKAAVRRLNARDGHRIRSALGRLDRCVKGMEPGQPWEMLREFCVTLATGKAPLPPQRTV